MYNLVYLLQFKQYTRQSAQWSDSGRWIKHAIAIYARDKVVSVLIFYIYAALKSNPVIDVCN